jgi:hypothetical protein
MANQLFERAIYGNPPDREEADFYYTPAWGTQALLAREKFSGKTWEPACGDGAMSRELEKALGVKSVMSTDLHDRGYGEGGVDFLKQTKKVANIVTNPPFTLAESFAKRALNLASKKVALLCRLSWLESAGRYELFTETPLARIYVFSNRLNCASKTWRDNNSAKAAGGTGGLVAYAWYVWDHTHTGATTTHWLLHPKHQIKGQS